MNNLLDALGYRRGVASQITLAALITGGILAVLFTSTLLARDALGQFAVHLILWVLWFLWLGWWFPTNRDRRMQADAATAYQRAFLPDILPGIWLGFAQLFRPLLAAVLNPPDQPIHWLHLIVAGVTVLGGIILVFLGHHSMDVATTTFVHEYKPQTTYIEQSGIYAYLGHPMFFGAVLISFGAGVIAGGTAFWLGVLNLGAAIVYSRVEDYRLRRIFGDAFTRYRESVGGFIPRKS